MHAPLPVLERGAAGGAPGGRRLHRQHRRRQRDRFRQGHRAHRYGRGGLSLLFAGAGEEARCPSCAWIHIAIPTTTGSGSEVAPTCGLRDPQVAKKVIFRDTRLIPSVAILDPQMTLDTPASLTAASGMTAVARCIESLYAGRRNPMHSGIALHALRLLVASHCRGRWMRRTISTARSQCLIASSMSAISANANVSAVHAIGHIVGGRYGLQHGIAHAILLAPTMRLMLPSIGAMQTSAAGSVGRLGAGIGADEAGLAAADIVARLVGKLPLPTRLRDVGVPKDRTSRRWPSTRRTIRSCWPSAAPIAADRIAALLQSVW